MAAPPPYTAPSGPWYAAPPPAYSANPNGYMGWVPPTNVFTEQPPGKIILISRIKHQIRTSSKFSLE